MESIKQQIQQLDLSGLQEWGVNLIYTLCSASRCDLHRFNIFDRLAYYREFNSNLSHGFWLNLFCLPFSYSWPIRKLYIFRLMILSILWLAFAKCEDIENVNGVRGDNVTLTLVNLFIRIRPIKLILILGVSWLKATVKLARGWSVLTKGRGWLPFGTKSFCLISMSG